MLAHAVLFFLVVLWHMLALEAPNTTIAKFANTADSDETAHNEPSNLDL